MRKHVITFSGAAYDQHTGKLVQSFQKFGADSLAIYDEPWLKASGFVEQNRWLWEHKGIANRNGGRGYGLYSWKPFIIMDALSKLEPGDMVLYVDADTYPIADVSPLFDHVDAVGGHMAFMATGKLGALCNRQWVKHECFQCMGLTDPKYLHGPHSAARFMVFEKPCPSDHREVMPFLNEWQHHCLCRNCQTFDHDPAIQHPGPHGDGPFAGFREHRTEQAIYSLLCIKYGRRLFREACEYGNECAQDWDLYPQLFRQEGTHGPQTEHGSLYRDQFPVPEAVRV